MIQPLKINKKTDNDAKLAQIIKENIPAYEYMSADEVNSMVGKINEMVPAINVSNGGFQGTLSVNEKRVDSGFYIPTESGTFINADNIQVDLSQGINFVTYDGDKWEVAVVPIVADGQVAEGNGGFVSGGEVWKSSIGIENSLLSISSRINLFNPINILHNTLLSHGSEGVTLVYNEGSITAFFPIPSQDSYYTLQDYPINNSGRRATLVNTLSIGTKGKALENNVFKSNNKYLAFGLKYEITGEYLNPENVMISEGTQKQEFSKYSEVKINTTSNLTDNSMQPLNSEAVKSLFDMALVTNVFNPINLLHNTLLSQKGDEITISKNEGSITGYCKLLHIGKYKIMGHPIDAEGRRSSIVSSLNYNTKGVNNTSNIISTDQNNQYLVFGLRYGINGEYLLPENVAILNDITEDNFIQYGVYKEKRLPIIIDYKSSSLMIGASFSHPANGWYERAYSKLGSYHLNKGDGGGVMMSTYANKIFKGELYDKATLDKFNHLVIYLSHNEDVYGEPGLKEKYSEYEPINGHYDQYNNSQFWDYFLKKYYADCYSQKDNHKSKYYGTKNGKPVSLVVFTHWHDGRALFNESIRKLKVKWGFNLIELYKYIGFNKEQLHPITQKQISLDYAVDKETIKHNDIDVTFGWHPIREGQVLFVQDRTERIFLDFISKL